MYDEYDDESDANSNIEELEQRVEELEQRIGELEESHRKLGESRPSSRNYDSIYLLGTIIAIVLSWTRNASILWCILHGILSWIYVIYFAFTR
jgi:hypothetical protein